MILSVSAFTRLFSLSAGVLLQTLGPWATDRAPSLSSDRRSSLAPSALSHWGSHANPPVPRNR